MHAEERATPGKHYYQQLMIQSYILIKQLAADILKYEKQDFNELKEAAAKKAHELKENVFNIMLVYWPFSLGWGLRIQQ